MYNVLSLGWSSAPLILFVSPLSSGLSDPPGPPGSKRPPMLTFKHFLSQQDDNIDEAQAIHSYNDYKVDFKRRQISEFFDNHKEGDW